MVIKGQQDDTLAIRNHSIWSPIYNNMLEWSTSSTNPKYVLLIFFTYLIFWLIGVQIIFYQKLIVIEIERRLWANLLANIGSKLVK